MNRRVFLTSSLAAVGLPYISRLPAETPPNQTKLGLLLYSFGIRAKADTKKQFAQPIPFLKWASTLGANAIQLPLGICGEKEGLEIRRLAEKMQIALEGIITPPRDTPGDQERFVSEIQSARTCGATVLRMVMLGGRRYEVFKTREDFSNFAKQSIKTLEQAETIAAKHRVQLAVENHKDFRWEELLDLLKKVSSEWIGICLDTGNNLALLDDPDATVTALAPLTRTVHLKDIAFEEAPEGFRMAEVPLGAGSLDLQKMVKTIHKANPRVRFHLEMITRDPLLIPCLQESYWVSLEKVLGRDLARVLSYVKKRAGEKPLPRLSKMPLAEQLELEERHVRESFRYAAKSDLIPT